MGLTQIKSHIHVSTYTCRLIRRLIIGPLIVDKTKETYWIVAVTSGCQLWLLHRTILVLDVGTGSTLEQLQGTLPLASIGCTVQRSVTQQICAGGVWRLFLAELHTGQKQMCCLSPWVLYYSDKNWSITWIFGTGIIKPTECLITANTKFRPELFMNYCVYRA